MKKCSKCKETREIVEFYIDKRTGTPRSWCKKCRGVSRDDWKAKNKNVSVGYVRRWRKLHPEKYRESLRESARKKRTLPKGKLNRNVSRSIGKSLRRNIKGRRHWESLVGYTVHDLKRYLEKNFTLGMSWENYGTYWHIDHKTPQAAFNYEKPEDIDFKRCWRLENLQPMCSTDNIKKGAKIEMPFQPSLTI